MRKLTSTLCLTIAVLLGGAPMLVIPSTSEAASSGYKGAVKPRDILEKEMTPSHLVKAQKLAPECVRKKYKGC